MSYENDIITRKDLDDFSAKILVTFGLINTAAIAAVLASNEVSGNISVAPFAIGLISAVVAQLFWYFISALEYCFEEIEIFSDKISNAVWVLLLSFIILGGGCASAASIVYGCFLLLQLKSPFLWTFMTCGIPFCALFYILIRKSWP